ncbi:MAG TPA: aminodeoxychorismate synthase component I [Phycisphaerales bacterium]|nr:aminodeoxychorismate synthase component I [Phycisphaerales bacterium]
MTIGLDIPPARLEMEAIDSPAAPGALLDALCGQDSPTVLESAARDERFGRYTLLSCRPLEVLSLREGLLTDCQGAVLARGDEQLWESLSRAMTPQSLPPDAALPADAPPYAPGWIGYLGYELGRHIEKLPGRAVRDTHLPDARLAFHDALLIHDGLTGRWWLASLRFDSPPPGAGAAAEALRSLLTTGGKISDARHAPRPRGVLAPPDEFSFSPADYRRAVARCVEYIAAGDIFQVNLSQRFTLRDAPDPLRIYQALRRDNPAWYAAYLGFEHQGRLCAIASSSPELFLRLRGEHVLTRPIKGTRPRTGQADADRVAAAELLASEKDNAELAMIIDLLRNDLGRVCRFGSVRVSEPRVLEEHPTVYHLVGTVQGRLRQGVGPAEVLRATFPGGSITGAPKIRAMEIIDELEPCARGVYTGCIGIAGVNGVSEWNIAIRTVVWDDGKAHVQAGGGIVADSTPRGEYEETLHKARALLQAIAVARGDGYD